MIPEDEYEEEEDEGGEDDEDAYDALKCEAATVILYIIIVPFLYVAKYLCPLEDFRRHEKNITAWKNLRNHFV